MSGLAVRVKEIIMTNEMNVALADLIERSRSKIGHTFPISAELSDALQSAIGAERLGACDENLEYTPGFLSYAQLEMGAEYSVRVNGYMFCIKDYGQGRGVCIRCENRG